MTEADFKRKLVAEIKMLPGGYARRVEDRWAVGVLDLIIKLPGLPIVFAEGKLIRGNLFAPSPAQFAEGNKILAASMLAVLIGWKDRVMYVSDWVEKAHIEDSFYLGHDAKYADVLAKYVRTL